MVSIKTVFTFVILIALTGCASFYQLNYDFNQKFEQGNIEQAATILNKNKKAEKSKVRFLYYANQGVIEHLLGNYEESNNWLEQAYLFGEDYQKDYLNFAASYFVNPNLIIYPGEDHEHLMLLYYKALNFLQMRNYDAALIECRRLNQRLHELGDKYASENKYQKDAFIHNLMGIIYDASGDYNNAFIAYRNSLEIYQNEFAEMFDLATPEQLKKDLLRTAALAGFPDELDRFSKELAMDYVPQPPSEGGDLLFFWHNGLGPVKAEWSINFVTVDGGLGLISFQNEEYGLDFPFVYDTGDGAADISSLQGTRIAFSKYVERETFFTSASLETNTDCYSLEKAEDINAIAFKTLRQRMLAELSKGLLRVALKKTIEKQVGEENETLGFLVGLANFVSEKADTRNWQTLPHSIYYSRVPLKAGKNEIVLQTENPSMTNGEKVFLFFGKKGKTQFQSYRSFESNISF